MKVKHPELFGAYKGALSRFLEVVPQCDLTEARELGEEALAQGLETLDLAILHQEALIVLVIHPTATGNHPEKVRLAGTFFAEAVTPIEGSHRTARVANIKLNSAIEKLKQQATELVAFNAELQIEIKNREALEESLRISETTSTELLAESLHLQEELRSLSRRLLVAQEEERKRISRELHDVASQTLTSINIRLAALTQQTEAHSQEMSQKLAETQRHVEESVNLVHRFAKDLRPTILDDLGLIPALESYLQDFMDRTGIRASLAVFRGVEKLNIAVRTVFYRVAQEALINVSHHSKATKAKVTIRRKDDSVLLEIHDNGKGFAVDNPTRAQSCQRLGLLGMKERVQMVGGLFSIESAPGKETIIRVEVPYQLASEQPPEAQLTPSSQ